jgi:hypothetical protein
MVPGRIAYSLKLLYMFTENLVGSKVRKNLMYAFIPLGLPQQVAETKSTMPCLQMRNYTSRLIYIF